MKKEWILAIAIFLMIVVVTVWGALHINLIPVFNLVLLASLIAVTVVYACSTIEIARHTEEQAKEIREQRVMASRPIIIQKAVPEKDGLGFSQGYFSHFEVYNAGNGPAIEVEISIMLGDRETSIQSRRESFLRAGESPIEFRPFDLASREKSTCYLLCEYQSIPSHAGPQQTWYQAWYQTWLPFEPIKSSKEDKMYVRPGELEFCEVSKEKRVDAFISRSKPR